MQDVHISCALEHLHELVKALEAQFKAQADAVSVLDFGSSCKQFYGYVVVEWVHEMDEAFLKQLLADEAVIDACVYTVPSEDDDWPFESEFTTPS